MTPIRPTTSPPPSYKAADRPQRASRTAVLPVQLEREVEADRRRSVREELDAAEERLPFADADPQEPDVQDVVDQLGRLGDEALRLLQPIGPDVRRLVDGGHIDEQA